MVTGGFDLQPLRCDNRREMWQLCVMVTKSDKKNRRYIIGQQQHPGAYLTLNMYAKIPSQREGRRKTIYSKILYQKCTKFNRFNLVHHTAVYEKTQSFSDRRGVPPNRFFVTHKNSKVISRDIAHGLALSKVIPEMLQNSDKAQRKSRRKNNSENHHSGATNFRLFANRINQILIFKRISS